VKDASRAACPSDSGRLRRSIWYTVRLGGLSAEVGPFAFYGGMVEFGTSKMGPRPFMGPAADQVAPEFERALGNLGGDVL
jgi:HK97 gp10 family phage protein